MKFKCDKTVTKPYHYYYQRFYLRFLNRCSALAGNIVTTAISTYISMLQITKS